jgi:hypothetical protein
MMDRRLLLSLLKTNRPMAFELAHAVLDLSLALEDAARELGLHSSTRIRALATLSAWETVIGQAKTVVAETDLTGLHNKI